MKLTSSGRPQMLLKEYSTPLIYQSVDVVVYQAHIDDMLLESLYTV